MSKRGHRQVRENRTSTQPLNMTRDERVAEFTRLCIELWQRSPEAFDKLAKELMADAAKVGGK